MTGSAIYPPPSQPMDVARQLVLQYQHQGHLTLRRWRGDWYEWIGPRWLEIDHGHLRSKVYASLEAAVYESDEGYKPWAPNRRKVGDVLEALEAVCHLEARVNAPEWIDTDDHPQAGEIIACENTLLHVATRTMIGHTPALFNIVSVPFNYSSTPQPTPAWDSFLNSVWPDDQESIQALQEFCGYVLSGRTDLQKILMLIGPTRSGKGTIGRALTALVGRENTAGPTLSSLGQNFGLAPLVGSSLALVSDARMSGDTHVVVERLLSISGEDTLTIDRKYREPWTGKMSARLAVMTNELPRLGDASGALANRFLIITMSNSFLGKEDRTLDRRIATELGGILTWALDGLDRLESNGAFTAPESSQAFEQMLADLASPINAFLRQETVQDPTGYVDTDTLYAAWCAWTEDNGHKRSSKNVFIRDVKSAAGHVDIGKKRAGDKRVKVLSGIRLAALGEQTIGNHPGHPGPPPPTSVNATAEPESIRDHPAVGDSAGTDAGTDQEPKASAKPQVIKGGPGWNGSNPIVSSPRPSGRACPECGGAVPAGIVRHPECFRAAMKESA